MCLLTHVVPVTMRDIGGEEGKAEYKCTLIMLSAENDGDENSGSSSQWR